MQQAFLNIRSKAKGPQIFCSLAKEALSKPEIPALMIKTGAEAQQKA